MSKTESCNDRKSEISEVRTGGPTAAELYRLFGPDDDPAGFAAPVHPDVQADYAERLRDLNSENQRLKQILVDWTLDVVALRQRVERTSRPGGRWRGTAAPVLVAKR